jgi:acyl-CoA thioester hydrolase
MRLYSTEYRVTYADCDPFNVVYYANYFTLFERGRTELFRDMGIPYSNIEKQGVYVPVSDTRCTYKRSARYDDLLQIETGVQQIKRASLTIAYRITRNDELLAEGYTIHAFVNSEGRPQRIPPGIIETIEAYTASAAADAKRG